MRQPHPSSFAGTKTMEYDLAGRMTRLTWPDAFYVTYDYNVAGDMTQVREQPAGSGLVLGTYAYDDLGRRTSLTRGNGTSTTYGYDAVSRLASLVQDLSGSGSDLTLSLTHDPASGIATNTRSNDAFAYIGHANQNVTDTVNGLNQVTATGATSLSHDARGNISAIGGAGYAYTSENRMTSGNGTTLIYDPAGRLMLVDGSPQQRLDMLGHTLITELDSSHVIQRRYAPGPGVDEPLVWYEGAGTSDRRWLHADERGSIVAVSDGSGNLVGTRNRYDDYGAPQDTLTGRFGYTGQAWIGEIGLYYYRARMYNPALGRFMQTDPIGYSGGMNLYGYAGANPINFTDPFGLAPKKPRTICTGTRISSGCGGGGLATGLSGFSTAGVGGQMGTGEDSLNALGVDTSGMSNGEIRDLAYQFWQFGEWALASGLSRDAVFTWGFNSQDFVARLDASSSQVFVPGFIYRALQESFLSATFEGSASKIDEQHAIARNPILRQNAVATGTMFYISSIGYTFPSVLLQAEVGWGGRQGIVEYIMPQTMGMLFGSPVITHARFIPGMWISGYPNNDRGVYPPFGII